jgi:hypothetical protein
MVAAGSGCLCFSGLEYVERYFFGFWVRMGFGFILVSRTEYIVRKK